MKSYAGTNIPDSEDEIDLSLPVRVRVQPEEDVQRQRYLKRFQQKVVDVHDLTSRLLKVCGRVKQKHPMHTNRASTLNTMRTYIT